MDICYETMKAYANLSKGSIEPVRGTLYKRVVTPNWTMLIRPVVYGYEWELTDIYDIYGDECYSYRYNYGEMSHNATNGNRDKVRYLLALLEAMRDMISWGSLEKREPWYQVIDGEGTYDNRCHYRPTCSPFRFDVDVTYKTCWGIWRNGQYIG